MRGLRRPSKMDLLVIRLSKTGILSNSRPCYHCIKQLEQVRFVSIKNVYYSDSAGNIVCQKFDDLVMSPTQFISSGYRHRMGLPRNVYMTEHVNKNPPTEKKLNV